MLHWQSYWFERSLSLQRSLPQAPPLEHDPIFVLGLWRSGTTYLHEMLGACPGLLHPATWQCMNAANFRLRQKPVATASVQRPMDGFTIDAFSPQEDEFALLALGVPSVYRGFLDPRRIPELTQLLDPDSWSCDRPPGWMTLWREFLDGVVAGNPGRLVLKSPAHSFRIRALAEGFPNGSFVWLVRDPVETFLSNRKMWLAMFERYAFWEWNSTVLDQFLLRAFARAAESLSLATSLLPKERLVVVEFDRMVRAPLDTLEGLNRRLHLVDWKSSQPVLEKIIANKANYRHVDHLPAILSDVTIDAAKKLRMEQHSARSSHGLSISV
jgi:hypothetical protein